MTRHYGIIESVLLLPITWHIFHAKTSASLITWVGGPIPGGFHRDDRHSCPYTKALLLAREKAKNMDIEEIFLYVLIMLNMKEKYHMMDFVTAVSNNSQSGLEGKSI